MIGSKFKAKNDCSITQNEFRFGLLSRRYVIGGVSGKNSFFDFVQVLGNWGICG